MSLDGNMDPMTDPLRASEGEPFFGRQSAAHSMVSVPAAGCWEVVIVGAGPAGSMLALQLARRGVQVLLVEKASFPRYKVCGGCLNATALHALSAAGLSIDTLGGTPIEAVQLVTSHGSTTIALPAGKAISRARLDAMLVNEARAAGAEFLSGTAAKLQGGRQGERIISLEHGGRRSTIGARVVIAADGLDGGFLSREGSCPTFIDPLSAIGAGCLLESSDIGLTQSSITMACAAAGYVGMVALENGQLGVAASMNRAYVRERGGPARAAARILRGVALRVPGGLESATWRGTPALTRRRRRLGGQRLFVLGDAARYVQPFTGEGIAWALCSAQLLVSFVLQGLSNWSNRLIAEWEMLYRRKLGQRQRSCQVIDSIVRRPWLLHGFVRIPALASLAARWMNRPIFVEKRCLEL